MLDLMIVSEHLILTRQQMAVTRAKPSPVESKATCQSFSSHSSPDSSLRSVSVRTCRGN